MEWKRLQQHHSVFQQQARQSTLHMLHAEEPLYTHSGVQRFSKTNGNQHAKGRVILKVRMGMKTSPAIPVKNSNTRFQTPVPRRGVDSPRHNSVDGEDGTQSAPEIP